MITNIRTLLPLAQRIYDRSAVGCCLHIVLDDENVETSSVAFCVQQARKENHADCLELATALMECSITQRTKLGRLVTR